MKTADDFEIGPVLYLIVLAFVFVAAALSTVIDFGNGQVVAGWLDLLILVADVLGFVLAWRGWIGRNMALGLVIYTCAINFMALGLSLYFSHAPFVADQVLYSLVASMVFMGGAGFIVQRWGSLALGAVTTAYLCFLTFSVNNKFLNDSFPALVALTVGFSIVLFFYRGRLEIILRKLHDGTTTLEAQTTELSRLKEAAEQALAELKRTQSRVVAQEKLASLGALIAGIAHEIKNPLNFITNFAQSSIELMDELKGHFDTCRQGLNQNDQADVDYLLAELDRNMKDIAQHGQRGDRIVKSMLMHSRGASGVFSSEDIGVLVEECVNLAFHALRAQDTTFQSGKTLRIPEGLPPADLVRADFARVLLNLCNNAFYSVHKKRLSGTCAAYEPMVAVEVAAPNEELVLSISDNGTGMSREVRAKLFTPFFTTKPTGEGTGLGLSLSHDIIVSEHGGQIEVETTEGQGACFVVRVPLRHRTQGGSGEREMRVIQ